MAGITTLEESLDEIAQLDLAESVEDVLLVEKDDENNISHFDIRCQK